MVRLGQIIAVCFPERTDSQRTGSGNEEKEEEEG